jgi:tetratricopeptide (TPR) repeat protein
VKAAQALLLLDKGMSVPLHVSSDLVFHAGDCSSCEEALLTAKVLGKLGRYQLAKDCLQKFEDGHNDSPDCLLELAWLALECKEPDSALQYCRRAIALEPDSYEAFAQAGLACARGRDYRDAVAYLKQSLKLYPSQFDTRFLLGKILCASGYEKDGLEQIVWASRQEPQNAQTNLYVTAYYIAKLQWDQAAKNLQLLRSKMPNDLQVEALAAEINQGSRPGHLVQRYIGLKGLLNRILAI